MTSDLIRRLDALEIRVAHQDATIEALNTTITAQWRTLDALRRDVASLKEQLQESSRVWGEPEPPPPHY